MDDEVRIDFAMPLDADGFLRRECPTCEREFKWFHHPEGDLDAEPVDQYFCPLCGAPAPTNTWLTQPQALAARELAQTAALRLVQDALGDAFRGSNHVRYKPGQPPATPTPPDELLHEPNDMSIVEPPCHPNEPVKVPGEALGQMHCLVCGSVFAVG